MNIRDRSASRRPKVGRKLHCPDDFHASLKYSICGTPMWSTTFARTQGGVTCRNCIRILEVRKRKAQALRARKARNAAHASKLLEAERKRSLRSRAKK